MKFKVISDLKRENTVKYKKQRHPSFKGIGGTLNAVSSTIQTDKIIGATVVGGLSMIGPRTAIDFTRGSDAGIETLAREVSSPIIECFLPGIFVVGIGRFLGRHINKKVHVDTSLSIDSDTVKVLGNAWKDAHIGKNKVNSETLQTFVKNVYNDIKGLVGEEFVGFSEELRKTKTLDERTVDLINKGGELSKKELGKVKNQLKADAVSLLGASENLRITKKINGKTVIVETTMDRLFDNLHDLGKVFKKDVPDVGIDGKKLDAAVNKITTVNGKKALITLGIITCMGFSLQFINRYITKKRTGTAAFVGLPKEMRTKQHAEQVENQSKLKLNAKKAVSVAGILSIAAAAITNRFNPKKILKELKPKKFIKKLEFNGKWSNINQLKAVYSVIIAGRILASSDNHELRETNIRDIPGFISWLVLGGFISKLTGNALSKDKKLKGFGLLNGKPLNKSDNFFDRAKNFLNKRMLITHAEIKALAENKKTTPEIKALLDKKLNKSIGAGILYSVIALGVCIPWLNKKITAKITAAENNSVNLSPDKKHAGLLSTRAKIFFKNDNLNTDKKIIADFMHASRM